MPKSYKQYYSKRGNKPYMKRGGFKRTYRKFFKNWKNKSVGTTMIRAPGILSADRYATKLKWYGRTTFKTGGPNGAATWPVTYSFVGNSLKPTSIDNSNIMGQIGVSNAKVVGSLYGNYVILGSKIKASLINLNTDLEIIANVYPSTSTFSATRAKEDQPPYVEHKYAKHKVLTVIQGSKDEQVIKNYMTTAKIWGVPKKAITILPGYAGSCGDYHRTGADTYDTTTDNFGDPLNTWWWEVNLTDGVGTSTGRTFSMEVEIVYYVQFYNRENAGLWA